MTYPPTELLKTSLFFGCKAESFFIRLGKLAEKFPNTTGEQILAGEYLLCQGIRFALDRRKNIQTKKGQEQARSYRGNVGLAGTSGQSIPPTSTQPLSTSLPSRSHSHASRSSTHDAFAYDARYKFQPSTSIYLLLIHLHSVVMMALSQTHS